MSEFALYGGTLEGALYGNGLEGALYGGEPGKMSIQINVNGVGGALAGWNSTGEAIPAPGIILTDGNVVDDNNDPIAGVTLELVLAGDANSSAGINEGWPHTIDEGTFNTQLANDTDWPNPEITRGYWFSTGTDLELRLNGLAEGVYDVKAYAGARDDSALRTGTITITGNTGIPVSGLKQTAELTPTTSDRVLTGQVTVDGTGTITVLAELATFAGGLAGFTVSLVDAGSPILTTPHSNTIITLGAAGLTGGFSVYSYANTNIASTAVIVEDFWGGIRKINLEPLDVIYCQLSDGLFRVSMLTTTTGELV